MKDELDRRADQVYFERAELMAELAFENPDSLDVVSSTLEITPQETELVTKKQLVNEFRIPSVLKIFNDDVLVNRYNSEPVETPDDNIFIFRVKKHEKATIPEFKNVQEQVKQNFIETQLKEATIELAEAVITELRELVHEGFYNYFTIFNTVDFVSVLAMIGVVLCQIFFEYQWLDGKIDQEEYQNWF